MLNNFVSSELLFTKLSGIHPYEKCIKSPGGHAWRHVFMACSKLEARGHLLHKTGTPPKHFSRECMMWLSFWWSCLLKNDLGSPESHWENLVFRKTFFNLFFFYVIEKNVMRNCNNQNDESSLLLARALSKDQNP